jgi:hypothetical protein
MRDRKGLERALVIAKRNIFAFHEAMGVETKPGFVVRGRAIIVIDHPSAAARSTRPVNKPTVTHRLAVPDTPYAAAIAGMAPGFSVEMARRIERGHDVITMREAALWVLRASSETKRNLLEHHLLRLEHLEPVRPPARWDRRQGGYDHGHCRGERCEDHLPLLRWIKSLRALSSRPSARSAAPLRQRP